MTDAETIRIHLAAARAVADNIQRTCDEALEAVRSKDETKLRTYVGCCYSEATRVKVHARRATDALNRLPLDGLLRASLEEAKRG